MKNLKIEEIKVQTITTPVVMDEWLLLDMDGNTVLSARQIDEIVIESTPYFWYEYLPAAALTVHADVETLYLQLFELVLDNALRLNFE